MERELERESEGSRKGEGVSSCSRKGVGRESEGSRKGVGREQERSRKGAGRESEGSRKGVGRQKIWHPRRRRV